MQNLIYTNIQHQPRKKFGLSLNDYVLCDMIYHLSNNPQYNWCILGKESMAEELGLSKRGILNILEKLIDLGFILKDPQTRFLKTTEKWYNEFVTYGEESAPVVQKGAIESEKSAPKEGKKCTPSGEKSAHNNNIYNNTDNNIIYIENISLNNLILEFIEARKQLKKPMTPLAITKLVNKCLQWEKKHSIEIIKTFFDRAIECGWAGVFEQKEKSPTASGQKTAWVDYAGEKEKTLKREADANKAKQDEQDAMDNQKRYDAMAIQWFGRLPEGDLKNKINAEIDENLTIKKAFEIAELQPLGSLMRDQKFEFAKNQRERMRILHIRKYYEVARELAR